MRIFTVNRESGSSLKSKAKPVCTRSSRFRIAHAASIFAIAVIAASSLPAQTRLAGELQDHVLRLRMQPLATLADRLSQAVTTPVVSAALTGRLPGWGAPCCFGATRSLQRAACSVRPPP